MIPLVLASQSPRRKELLSILGIPFSIVPSSIDEIPARGENPEQFVVRVARQKGMDVASRVSQSVVLSADTVVTVDGEILGKPASPSDAAQMLSKISGRTHRVMTGVCLVLAPRRILALEHETTRVRFRKLSAAEIRDYLRSGEPFDKAGAYGIQGLASKYVTRIEGCFFNVVGLPVPLVYEMLKPFLTDIPQRVP